MDYVAGRRSTKLIFARFTSMRILWNVELDNGDNNGDNIDTSILMIMKMVGWPDLDGDTRVFSQGNLCKEIKFYEERILTR